MKEHTPQSLIETLAAQVKVNDSARENPEGFIDAFKKLPVDSGTGCGGCLATAVLIALAFFAFLLTICGGPGTSTPIVIFILFAIAVAAFSGTQKPPTHPLDIDAFCERAVSGNAIWGLSNRSSQKTIDGAPVSLYWSSLPLLIAVAKIHHLPETTIQEMTLHHFLKTELLHQDDRIGFDWVDLDAPGPHATAAFVADALNQRLQKKS